MWICPNCERTFKRRNQAHYCGKAHKTIDDYIMAQPQETQRHLTKMREAIRTALPQVQERIAWNMPTYWKQKNIIQFAACKNHISLYVGTEAIEAFHKRLEEYKTNKSAIHFLYSQPLPSDLIADIAKWCCKMENHL
ncbi:MAG: iron chaperone [Oscillospiraceae bacterium]|jgi:uncharacterized protein YdhG (YjbR/CyaY superfamily)